MMKNLLEHYLGEESENNESERVPSKDVIDSSSSVESGVSSSSGNRFSSVVVLVDPPRSGLHPVVRKHRFLVIFNRFTLAFSC